MSDRLRLDLVVNDFVAAAVASGKISILSNGLPWRPLINVKDMARAIEWAILRDLDAGGEFAVVNTGSDAWNYQIKDLAEAVTHVIPNVDVSVNKAAPADRRSYRVDFSRFRDLAPNHQPQCDLTTTIAELNAGLAAIGFKDQSFRDSSLIRLNTLTNLISRGALTEQLFWAHRKQPRDVVYQVV
jgi:nucleoside-diphosphate-sugar epimerase